MDDALLENETRTLPKGATVALSGGEYSSYGFWAVAIATQEIEIPILTRGRRGADSTYGQHIRELLRSGVLREVEYYEWHDEENHATFHRGELPDAKSCEWVGEAEGGSETARGRESV